MHNIGNEIPLCIPDIGKDEIKEVSKVLKSHWLTHGPKNEEFEKNFADFIGVKRAVTLNSCTSALFLAVLAQGITGEVLVPSFTFAASANAIVTAGAHPVFVDINADDFCINSQDIENKITKNTQAIVCVHYAGQSCAMDSITYLARKYNLKIIEDSAQAVGAAYKNIRSGGWGLGCFSFFPTKNLTTGEGGMITTNDDELADKIKAMASHGIPSTTLNRKSSQIPWVREAIYAGYNFRMSNILAAIGVEQLKRLGDMNNKRRERAFYLNNKLKDVDEIAVPCEAKNRYHVYQMYVIRLRSSINRDELVLKLRSYRIGASVHYDPPVHLHPYYRQNFGCKPGDLEVTETVSKTIVTLPMYPQLEKVHLNQIVRAVKKAILEIKRG